MLLARWREVSLVAMLSVAAGCAQLPFLGPDPEQGSPRVFEVIGRVYVRFDARAFSGSLRWRHDTRGDEVWLSGPLGQTGAYIVRNSTGASLTTADQRTYHSASIDSLTRDGLGWSLPLADLSYYVVGEVPPDPSVVVERDAAGHPMRLQRDGWTVRWGARSAAGIGAGLPRLNLRKGDVEIRLVVDQMQQPRT
jgi:outer membrane lipoprotein LolB